MKRAPMRRVVGSFYMAEDAGPVVIKWLYWRLSCGHAVWSFYQLGQEAPVAHRRACRLCLNEECAP